MQSKPIPRAVVLRPEPGNGATAARLAAAGVSVIRQPLFAVAPVAWHAPEPARFDALLLTSANAARHAGTALQAFARLPVLVVGAATAKAAMAAGLKVQLTGEHDAAALVAVARAQGFQRLIHLAGHDRIDLPGVEAVTVYRSDAVTMPVNGALLWEGNVALLHSVRAARRFAELVDRDGAVRARIAIAALSAAVRKAAGGGWNTAITADWPTDAALVASVAVLIDPSGGGVDKLGR